MAVASQKMTEIRFLLRIRGALMAAPTMLAPVMKIPLQAIAMTVPQPTPASHAA